MLFFQMPRIGYILCLLVFLSIDAAGFVQSGCYEPSTESLKEIIAHFSESQTHQVSKALDSIHHEFEHAFFPVFQGEWDDSQSITSWLPHLSRWAMPYATYLIKRAFLKLTSSQDQSNMLYFPYLSFSCEAGNYTFTTHVHLIASPEEDIYSKIQHAFPKCRVQPFTTPPQGLSQEQLLDDILAWEIDYAGQDFLGSHYHDYFLQYGHFVPLADTSFDSHTYPESIKKLGDILSLRVQSESCSESNLTQNQTCFDVNIPESDSENLYRVSHLQTLFYQLQEDKPGCLKDVTYHDYPWIQIPESFRVCYEKTQEDYITWRPLLFIRALIEEASLDAFCLPSSKEEGDNQTITENCIPLQFHTDSCLDTPLKLQYEYPLNTSLEEVKQAGEWTVRHGTRLQHYLKWDQLPSKIHINFCENKLFSLVSLNASESICPQRPYLDQTIRDVLSNLKALQLNLESVRASRRIRNRSLAQHATERMARGDIAVMPSSISTNDKLYPYRRSKFEREGRKSRMLRKFQIASLPSECFDDAEAFTERPLHIDQECVVPEIDSWARGNIATDKEFQILRASDASLAFGHDVGLKQLVSYPIRQIADLFDYDTNTVYQYQFAHLPLEQHVVAIAMRKPHLTFKTHAEEEGHDPDNIPDHVRQAYGRDLATSAFKMKQRWSGVRSDWSREEVNSWKASFSEEEKDFLIKLAAKRLHDQRELWAHLYAGRMLPTTMDFFGVNITDKCGDMAFLVLADAYLYRTQGKFLKFHSGEQDITLMKLYDTFDDERPAIGALFSTLGTTDDELWRGAHALGFDNLNRVRTWDEIVDQVDKGNPVMVVYIPGMSHPSVFDVFPTSISSFFSEDIFRAHYGIINAIQRDSEGKPIAVRMNTYFHTDWLPYDAFKTSWERYDNHFLSQLLGLQNYGFYFSD